MNVRILRKNVENPICVFSSDKFDQIIVGTPLLYEVVFINYVIQLGGRGRIDFLFQFQFLFQLFIIFLVFREVILSPLEYNSIKEKKKSITFNFHFNFLFLSRTLQVFIIVDKSQQCTICLKVNVSPQFSLMLTFLPNLYDKCNYL